MTNDTRDLLPELREIGFGAWDPLGLADAWKAGEAMADEYDRYLLQALSAAVNGADAGSIRALLGDAEVHMGLDVASPAPRRDEVVDRILTPSGRANAR